MIIPLENLLPEGRFLEPAYGSPMSAQVVAEELLQQLPDLVVGSLCMYGEWFGRPFDNQHRIVDVTVEDDDILVMSFSEGEALRVWSPERVTADRFELRIDHARRVRWDWYSYGSPRTEEHHKFIDYRIQSDESEQLWLVSVKGNRRLRRRLSANVPAVSIANGLRRKSADSPD